MTAGRLWAEASRITTEHLPFRPTVVEGATGLLERDPEQYWATMRVAQVLHGSEGGQNRVGQAVAEARKMAAQREVTDARGTLRGGVPGPDIVRPVSDGAATSRPTSGATRGRSTGALRGVARFLEWCHATRDEGANRS